MGRKKGPKMLRLLGGATLLYAVWVVIVFGLVLLLSGCGYFVADNPECLQHCSSQYHGPTTGGGV